jgi:predicted porin
MKKLLTAMLLSAGVSIAYAQSSVTVYGLLDMGYIGANQQLTSTAGAAATKTQTSQFGQGAEQTSRLGLKGSEDLGGGTSAFFTTEFQLYPQDQNLSGSTNSGLLNRQTFVGIKQTGIGAVSVGRQYTPIYNAYCGGGSASQCNNVTGDVIYLGSSSGGAGTSVATTITGQENGIGFTNRASNSIFFKSDDFKGATLSGLYQANNKNTTQTGAAAGGETNQSGGGLGLDYVYNKFSAHAAYQQFTQFTTGTAFSITDMNTGTIVSGKDTQTYLGADYDFGILKAYANYANRNITSTLNSSQFLKRNAEQIGVRGYIRPNIDAWVQAGLGSYTQVGTTSPVNFTAYQLGSNYYLSKRTNLYGIFGSTQSSGNVQTVAGAGSSKNMYAVGLRHTF